MNNIATDLTALATPLDGLKPLPGNPRKGDVDAVMRSYERFGQRKPIVALRDGTVIAGNHQLEAAKRLGWDAIAVVFTDDDESTAKAYALADNRVGELGGYDDQALLELLLDVDDVDDLLSATGYDTTMIDDLRNKLVAPSLDDLTSKYGELNEDSGDLWPSIKIKVPNDLFDAWNDLVNRCDKDPVKAFAFLIDEARS